MNEATHGTGQTGNCGPATMGFPDYRNSNDSAASSGNHYRGPATDRGGPVQKLTPRHSIVSYRRPAGEDSAKSVLRDEARRGRVSGDAQLSGDAWHFEGNGGTG
jgi:hypothetical protein